MLTLLTLALVATLAASLRICHHNDFHARYAEISRFNSPCSAKDSAAGKCFSSLGRLQTAFTSGKCDMRVFAGDFMQGSVYDTIFGTEIAIAAYKTLRYDLITLGNHEFNKGVAPVYDTIRQTPNSTWLGTNVILSAAPPTVQLVKHADRKGICWLSALTPVTLRISNPGKSVFIDEPSKALNRALTRCAQTKNVIAVTHLGFQNDVALCKAVPDLDLVIGGHSHTDLANGGFPTKVTRADGSACWVVQAAAFGRYMGMLDVSFSRTGVLKFSGLAYVPLDARIVPDWRTDALVATFTARLSNAVQKVVGSVLKPVDGARASCRAKECAMGNLVCAAMLAYAGPKQGATLCVQNGGGIRASLDSGPVTVEEVLTVLPFANVHAVLTVPGSTVVAALESGMRAVRNDENSGRFPQIAGMTLVADFAAPPGQRVKQVLVGGAPIVPSKFYVVVTNVFVANGGDGYDWPGTTKVELSGRAQDSLISEYLTANDPYTPFVDGRIKDVKDLAFLPASSAEPLPEVTPGARL